MKRGEIWLTTLDPTIGHEIRKTRPALILQNNVGNTYAATTIIAPITSQGIERVYPFEVFLATNTSGLPKSSKILLQHIRSVDKQRLKKRLGAINQHTTQEVNSALQLVLALE